MQAAEIAEIKHRSPAKDKAVRHGEKEMNLLCFPFQEA